MSGQGLLAQQGLMARKSVEEIVRSGEAGGRPLSKTLGPLSITAMGIGANPDQQQRLVLAVKDRVMNTVAIAKTLPAEMSSQRLGNVNLFMRSIGLDVELLQ